ncbi:MAG: ATP-dependent DNA helicase RecG [Candidatus Omnitrophica bacterium]|nr:ATP-dependent DNA helicase RecG [Candidatus Omnitrophota bacterium]
MIKPSVNLSTSLQYMKGVGPQRHQILRRLGLEAVGDVFYFFPRRYENRSQVKTVSDIAFAEEKECVKAQVQSRGMIRRPGNWIFRVVLSDGKKMLFAAWFNQPWLSKAILPHATLIVYGKAEKEGRHAQMIHPEYEVLENDAVSQTVHFGRIVPVYPLTEDLSQKAVRQLAWRVIEEFGIRTTDPLPASLKKRLDLKDSRFAFKNIHFPESFHDLDKARRRLVFDEFFIFELLIQIRRRQWRGRVESLSHRDGESQIKELTESLEFSLTRGQETAIDDIVQDMKKPLPMRRLVQGDVGSGKTVVAAAALLFTASNGFQGALMAPTEVLAQQHYFNLSSLLRPMGISCGYLGQSLEPREKKRVMEALIRGEIQVAIGTHALIQKDVRFKKLGLAVVDEQHKFGVFQRAALKDKGEADAHLLLMTATPIPRTLALTLYGDLDISVMTDRPAGRQPIQTLWVTEEKRMEIYRFMDDLIGQGRQAYVVCPAIEGRDMTSVKGVLSVFESFSRIFSHRQVGVLHGRMKSVEKQKAMRDFKDRKTEILVSTVVIEVGVDVPNATAMIIEDADRFGLAQLHQLRGRVGRGGNESFCFLFSKTDMPESVDRLRAFEAMESGFDIAEKDLALRGAGEIVGARQHGVPELRIADMAKDLEVLELAKAEAERLIEKDAGLRMAEHRALRKILNEKFNLNELKAGVIA